jgi:hypothetical protein
MKFTVGYHPYYFAVSDNLNRESTWIKKYVNKFNQFDFKHVDDIPAGTKYTVILDSNSDMLHKSLNQHDDLYSWILHDKNQYNLATNNQQLARTMPMPVRMWNDSARNLIHWIVVSATEGWVEDAFDISEMKRALNCDEDERNLTILTAAELNPKYSNLKQYTQDRYNINILHWNYLKEFVLFLNGDTYGTFLNRKMQAIHQRTPTDYKSICYNRMPRPHRATIVAHIINRAYTDCIYSFGKNVLWDYTSLPYSKDKKFSYLSKEFNYLNSLQEDIAPQTKKDTDLNFNHAVTLDLDDALASSFHVVTETVYNDNTYITEKSYKPFAMLQPFIQFGNQYNVQALRDRGYKTFDKYINHHYDSINDHSDRMVAFLAEFDRLQKLDWTDILYDIRHDLMHNLALVSQNESQNPMIELTDTLMQFYLKED